MYRLGFILDCSPLPLVVEEAYFQDQVKLSCNPTRFVAPVKDRYYWCGRDHKVTGWTEIVVFNGLEGAKGRYALRVVFLLCDIDGY